MVVVLVQPVAQQRRPHPRKLTRDVRVARQDEPMSEAWVPFGLTSDEVEQYHVLVDDVPAPLREAILGWLRPILSQGSYSWVIASRTIRLAMMARVDVGIPEHVTMTWENYVRTLRGLPDQQLLRVVDATLASEWTRGTERLEEALRLSKSKRTIGTR